MSFLCFRRLAVLLLGLTGTGGAFSEESTPTQGGDWLEQSRALIEQSASRPVEDWMNAVPSDEVVAMAEEIARDSGMRPDGRVTSAAYGEGSVLIFGSFSMPEETLRNLLSQAAEQGVTFVLRGLADATNVRATLNRLRRYIDEGEPLPNVVIDPTLYQQFSVTAAPTLVLLRDGDLQPVTVVGAVSVDWLRRQAGRLGATGNPVLGIRAEYYDIAEVDLIAEMQRRLARIDWMSKRRSAIDRFWRAKTDFVELPEAPEDREFEVDPSVRLTQNISDANGKVLMRAGDTINPLDLLPMTKTVVVFNGMDERQIEVAANIARRVRGDGRGVILLTTNVDSQNGWESLHSLERDLRGPVYLLQANLAERFQLNHVPSTVISRGNRLVINEHSLRTDDE